MKIPALFLFIVLFTAASASACRGNEKRPKDSFEEAAKKAPIAFVGTIVTAENPANFETKVTFKVEQGLKEKINEKLWFRIQTGRSCDLGKYVEIGSRWIILANEIGELILTDSHSRRLFDKKEELEVIEKLKK